MNILSVEEKITQVINSWFRVHFLFYTLPYIHNRFNHSVLLWLILYIQILIRCLKGFGTFHLNYTFNILFSILWPSKHTINKDTFKCKHKLFWSLSIKQNHQLSTKQHCVLYSESHLIHMKLCCFKPQRLRIGNFPTKMQELTNISSYLCLPYLLFYWSWE